VAQWKDAENNNWINQSLLSDVDHNNFHEMKVTFQGGKGNNHIVPVLFPLDTIDGMKKLVELHDAVGIPVDNPYVFPYTQSSVCHVSGWHAVKRVCTDANVVHPRRMTATKMRHRISTLYAAMDIPSQDRELFYKHMGHSLQVNQNVYQVPLAVAEITSVGSRLAQLDSDQSVSVNNIPTLHTSDSVRADSDQSVSIADSDQSVSINITRPQSDEDEARPCKRS